MNSSKTVLHALPLVLSIWVLMSSANAQTLIELQAKYQITEPDLQKIRIFLARDRAKRIKGESSLSVSQVSSPAALQGLPVKGEAPTTPSALIVSDAPKSPWQFLLREDWQDIDLLGEPKPRDKATGASFSYTDDRVAHNSIWAAHGTAALVYRDFGGTGAGSIFDPFYRSFAIYGTVNKLYNSDSKLAAKNIDILAAGGALELGWHNPGSGIQNYLQVRGGVVTDNIDSTTIANATAAWIPVNNAYYIHRPRELPFGYLGYSFDPQVLVQFASTTDTSKPLLFTSRGQALRIGPQLSLLLFPFQENDDFWSRVHANLTFHWWYEALYGAQNHWLKASATYDLDKNRNFGLTFSYQEGQNEETGKSTNLYLISLTGKI
jgi:hypothetical protein